MRGEGCNEPVLQKNGAEMDDASTLLTLIVYQIENYL